MKILLTYFPIKVNSSESPLRLALATILQYRSGLTDRQTADAVRTRIDWKYLLCLELTDSGFHHTVLSEFRTRLITGEAEALILEKLLKLCPEKGWLKSRMRTRTDSTHVLGAIRAITRLECVGETLRAALNTLFVVAPEWLLKNADSEWVKRYSNRIKDHHQPKSKSKREQRPCYLRRMTLSKLNSCELQLSSQLNAPIPPARRQAVNKPH